MFNLVEVQTALQSPSVQLADLMKYANGSSAEVPAYLALGELNRRKQLEATNTAFNAKPPTVKDQLTNAPPAVNPTAAPTGIAPTGAPQLASAVAAPPRMNVAAAPANQVNPIAPPQMAAEGGLLSIPTPHMFKQESYANGGIVAFSGKDDNSFVEPNAYQKEMQDKTEKLKLSPEQEARKGVLDAIKYLDEAKAAKDKKEIENWKGAAERGSATENELRAQRQAVEEKPAKDKQIADQMAADAASRNELMAVRQAQQKIDEEAQTKKLRDTDEANAALMKPKSIYRLANDDESVQSIAHPKNLQGLESLEKVDILSNVESNQPRLVSKGTPAVAGTNSLASALSNAAAQINAQKDAEIAKVRENGRLNNESAESIQFSIDKINHKALAKINGLGAAGGVGTTTGGRAATKDVYETQAQADARVANAGEAGGIPDAIKAGRVAPSVAPQVAPPVAAPIAPAPAAPTGIATGQYKAPTQAETQAAIIQEIANQKELRLKAGISDDPHKNSRERTDKLEAKRAAQEAEDPFNSLMARLAAFGKSTEQTFGGGMGDSAIAGAKLSKETAALRDKQATEIIAARQAMETADDARARGDLATAKAATEEVQKRLQKASELESAARTAGAHEKVADTGQMSAANTIAWTPFHEATLRMEADAREYLAHHPHATPEMVKANSLASIRREFKRDKVNNPTGRDMTEIEVLSAYSSATNSSKTDISDERNLSRERLKANTDWDNPMTVAFAKKMYGKDLTLPQLKAKFMDDRLSSLPGYTPSSGTTTTNAARAILNK